MSQPPFYRLLALAVRAGRRERGLSQRELARRAGLSVATVARIEGESAVVGVAPLRAVLGVVGLRLAVLRDDGSPFTAASALPLDQAGVVDRGGRRFPAHLPEDLERDHHYWRTWRDEQAGVTDRGPWTYRHWRPSSAEGWRRWNEQLWGPGAGRDDLPRTRFDPPSAHR